MTRPNRALAISMMVVLLAPAAIPGAEAFKPTTHIQIANTLLEEIQGDVEPDGTVAYRVVLDGVKYPLPPEVGRAIVEHPDAYRAGVVGPDAYPDVLMGQMVVHVDQRCENGVMTGEDCHGPGDGHAFSHEWLKHVYEAGWDYARDGDVWDPEDETGEVLAFVYGYLTHATGDMFAHTLVNELSGGPYPPYRDALRNEEDAANILRHLIVEGYIDRFAPQGDRNFTAPYDFVHQLFIVDRFTDSDGHTAEDLDQGPIFPFFLELRERLVEELEQTRAAISSCKKDVGCVSATIGLFGTNLAFLKIKEKYIENWIADIDEGLQKWPIMAEDLAKAMFLKGHGDPFDVIAEWTTGFSYRVNLVSMLGFPDFHREVLADLQESAIGKAMDKMYAFAMELVEGISEAIAAVMKELLKWLVLQAFGVDVDVIHDIMDHPEKYIDQNEIVVSSGEGLLGGRNTIEIGFSPATKTRVDDWMGVDGAVGEDQWDINDFAAAHNTLTMSKLVLMNTTMVDAFLCDHRVGVTYNYDWGQCQGPELPTVPPCIVEEEEHEQDSGYTPIDLPPPGSGGNTVDGDDPDPDGPPTDETDRPECRTKKEKEVAEGIVSDHLDSMTFGGNPNGTANIWILPDRPRYRTTDPFTAYIRIAPQIEGAGVEVEVKSPDDERIKLMRGSAGPFNAPATWTPYPFYFALLEPGTWTITAKYANAHAEMEFQVHEEYPDRNRGDNVMLEFIRSLDGHEQWRQASTQPGNPPGIKGHAYGEGMPVWSDCPGRHRAWRQVFDDWPHEYTTGTDFADQGEPSIPGISKTPSPKAWINVSDGPLMSENGVITVTPSTTLGLSVDTPNETFWAPGEYLIRYHLKPPGHSQWGPTHSVHGNTTIMPFDRSGTYEMRYRASGLCDDKTTPPRIDEHWHYLTFNVDGRQDTNDEWDVNYHIDPDLLRRLDEDYQARGLLPFFGKDELNDLGRFSNPHCIRPADGPPPPECRFDDPRRQEIFDHVAEQKRHNDLDLLNPYEVVTLANGLRASGEGELAAAGYDLARTLPGDDGYAWAEEATVLAAMGETDAALHALQTGLAAEAEDPVLLATAGWITGRQGDHEASLQYFQKSAENGGRPLVVQTGLSSAYAAMGRADDAAEALEPLLQSDHAYRLEDGQIERLTRADDPYATTDGPDDDTLRPEEVPFLSILGVLVAVLLVLGRRRVP